jgi:hypothetical protein
LTLIGIGLEEAGFNVKVAHVVIRGGAAACRIAWRLAGPFPFTQETVSHLLIYVKFFVKK